MYTVLYIVLFSVLSQALVFYGANARTRTADLLITSELLYQLSYVGPRLVKYKISNAESIKKLSLKQKICKLRTITASQVILLADNFEQ